MEKPVKTADKVVPKDIAKVPTATSGDTLHTLTRAGLSAIPSLGGPAVEIFNAIFTPPLNKRKDAWIHSIAKSLIELEGKVDGFNLETLSKNEVFITTVTHATYTAIRNHHEVKLTALRNAVINSALPNPPDEDLQLMFINFIDFLTPWHLRILSLFQDPKAYMNKNKIPLPSFSGGLRSMILHVFPELKGREDFLIQIVKDLYSRGLIHSDSIGTMLSDVFAPQTTNLGNQFVAFISSN